MMGEGREEVGGGRDGGKGERVGEVEAKEGEGRRKVLK